MKEIAGVIYPVPVEMVDRLFKGKTVYVKYGAHRTTKLAPKHKVIFYASHGSKKLVGEGKIKSVEFLTPLKVLEKYRDELFLTETELYAYVGGRSQMEMLTLVLTNLKKYSTPFEFNKPITMAGQYLTIQEYSSFIHKRSSEKNADP